MVHVKDEDILAVDARWWRRSGRRQMKIRKELWFGFALMALLIAGALYIFLTCARRSRAATSAC